MRTLFARPLAAAFLTLGLMGSMSGAALAQTPAAKVHPDANRLFVVFFELWSGDLDKPATQVIDHVAELAKQHPDDAVLLEGYSDPSGSARANALVSALRSQLVADALEHAGIDAGRIQQVANGSIDYVMNAQESRRVTIAVVPK